MVRGRPGTRIKNPAASIQFRIISISTKHLSSLSIRVKEKNEDEIAGITLSALFRHFAYECKNAGINVACGCEYNPIFPILSGYSVGVSEGINPESP